MVVLGTTRTHAAVSVFNLFTVEFAAKFPASFVPQKKTPPKCSGVHGVCVLSRREWWSSLSVCSSPSWSATLSSTGSLFTSQTSVSTQTHTHTHNKSAVLVIININPRHLLQLILTHERQETFQHCSTWEASWVSVKLWSQSFTGSLCPKLK